MRTSAALVTALVCSAACALLPLSASGEIIDRIAISVANQVITEAQIDEEVRLDAFLDLVELKIDVEQRKKGAGNLIEQALIKREMNLSRYLSPEPKDAEPPLQEIEKRYVDHAQYLDDLRAYGITEESLRRRLLWQVTVLRFIDYRFRSGIQVEDADMEAYYQQQLATWKRQGIQPVPTFQEARSQIHEILTQQHIDQALDTWFREERRRVPIQYHDEALR